MKQRKLVLLAILSTLVVAVTIWTPLHSKPINLVLIVGVLGLVFSIILWISKVYSLRIAFCCLSPFLLIGIYLSGRPWGGKVDSSAFRKAYVSHLESYEGAPYVWGGEARNGIDCSGLPRRAFRDSLRSLRGWPEYWLHWWFDASALALSEGYRGYVQPLGVSGQIREMNYSNLKPGDLAITSNGVHVVVYLGDEKWIQADPGDGKVVITHGRKSKNPWLRSEMKMYRWKEFMDSDKSE